jgi:hypothetical protein
MAGASSCRDQPSPSEERSYGTLLIDLERSVPLDLLADQSGTTFAPW